MVIFGNGGALPTCVTSLRRALPPEGDRMSAVQPLLPFPRPPRARERSLRRPFTPSRNAGPYRLPHEVWDPLVSALAPARNREAALALAVFLGRFWSTPARLVSAFPIDRRELADRTDLGLTEAQVRGAIRALEEVGFLDRALPSQGSRHRMTGAGELHRKPVLFQFGGDYAASFSRANHRAQKARKRHSHVRRALTPAAASSAATAPRMPVALRSPKNTTSEASKVLMGELKPRPPEPISANLKLEAALERWKRAAEGQGLLRSS
jgi:hypothetical protein